MVGFKRVSVAVGIGALLMCVATSAGAASLTISEVGKITPSDSSGFGVADLSGTTLLVGGLGKVHVFDKGSTGWTETGTGLSAGSAPAAQRFGQSVALDGATALIGAPGQSGASGAAYLFSHGTSGWSLGPTLASDAPSADDSFGASVALAGTVAAVVSTGDDTTATDTGAVFIYELASGQWKKTAKLVPPLDADSQKQLHYYDAKVTGSAVFVFASNSSFTTRQLDVYERSGQTWTVVGTLTSRASGDGFPGNIAASGDTLVGAATSVDNGAGALYVYTRGATSWDYQTTLKAPTPQSNEIMGVSLAFSGNTVIAGTYGSASGAQNSGGAVVFQRTGTTWSTGVRFWASDAQATDWDGSSVAIDGQNAAVFSGAKQWGYMLYIGVGAGQACSTDADCGKGACADGVCCDTKCDGVCESCLAAKKGAGSADGTCGPIAANTDPDNECADEGAASCGKNGSCDGAGACALYAKGTVCKAASCASPVAVDPADTCDGAGKCVANDVLEACSPLACVNGACKATCSADADCASGFSCNTTSGECEPASLKCSADRADLLDPAGKLLAHCTPYVCEAGRCLDQCATTTDCADGYVCGDTEKRCIAVTPSPPNNGGGCGCRVAPSLTDPRAFAGALIAFGAMALRRRGRRRRPCAT